MRQKLAVFSVPFALVLGLEYLLHAWDELPQSCIVLIPEPWWGLLTATILAGGVTWFRLRRSFTLQNLPGRSKSGPLIYIKRVKNRGLWRIQLPGRLWELPGGNSFFNLGSQSRL
jgi:hypothetical protein